MKTNRSPRVTLTPLALKMESDDERLQALVHPEPPIHRIPPTPPQPKIRPRTLPRDYIIQIERARVRAFPYRIQAGSHRRRSLLQRISLPFGVAGDRRSAAIMRQPGLVHYMAKNLPQFQPGPPPAPRAEINAVDILSQVLPGEAVLYSNPETGAAFSAPYYKLLLSQFGPPVARDPADQRHAQSIVQAETPDWYLQTALRFTHAANFVQSHKNLDVDLLELTNEVILGAPGAGLSPQETKQLQNAVLISLTALKVT